MWEVFDYITGETIGFVDSEREAVVAIANRPSADYICATHNSLVCTCYTESLVVQLAPWLASH